MRAFGAMRAFCALTAVLVVAGAAAAADVGRLGVDVAFGPKNKCAGMSPEIRLSDVPPGTTSYDVKLTDLDVPDFRHWSQTLPAAGPVIREGAGTKYYGPCPPGGTQHRYRIEVSALGATGTPLAKGDKTVTTGR